MAFASLKERFNNLSPEKRRKTILIGSVLGMLALMSAIVLIFDESGKAPKSRKVKEDATGNLLMGAEGRQLGLSGVSNELAELKRELDELKKTQARNASGQTAVPGMPLSPEDPEAALEQLAAEVGAEQEKVAPPPGTVFNPARPPAPSAGRQSVGEPPQNLPRLPSGPVPPPAPPAPTTPPVINSTRSEAPRVSEVRKRLQDVYIPTGSIMTGTLLTGLDAPTGRQAQGQPIPVVIRVKHDAILPSRYTSDVREAFILAAGFGDLSSERAYLRAERFSMVLRNNEVIDIPIKMSAVGNDGKSGLRGRLVSKQGAVIGKALLAGTADGVSRAFGGRSSYGGFGDNDLPQSSEVMAAGFGGGASTALDRIAAYFLDQAESMYPVIEIDAGREVSMVLLEGTALTPRVPDQVAAVSDTSKQR